MTIRLRMFIIVWLIAFDQLIAVSLFGAAYVVAGGARPNPDETISSCVGRAAIDGRWWALAVEQIIDGIFRLCGAGKGHCRASIEWDEQVPPQPTSDRRK